MLSVSINQIFLKKQWRCGDKEDSLIPVTDIVATSLNGVTLHENGSLYITSATLNDTGEYTCLAQNIVGMVNAGASVTVEGMWP